jgi:hypothetical protein
MTVQPQAFVAPVDQPVVDPMVAIRLRVGDQPLVLEGDRVEPGTALLEKARDATVVEVPDQGTIAGIAAGTLLSAQQLQAIADTRGPVRLSDHVRVVFHGPDHKARLAVGHRTVTVGSPVRGVVEHVSANAIGIRVEGLGVSGKVAWGMPVQGPLQIGAASPDAELRAQAINVDAAGAIIVTGARMDIEALTRARAIGVAGIICGGMVGRELRQLEESDRRQRAAIHAGAAFALLTLDGYGRRPIPGPTWDVLVAAAGRQVGLVPDTRIAVIGGDPEPLLAVAAREPGTVRIAGTDAAGAEGRLVGLAGPLRRPGGLYQPAGFVETVAAADSPRRRAVALADLERLG